MNLFTFLLQLAIDQKELSTFIKVAKVLKGNPRQLLKALVNAPELVSKKLGQLDIKGRKEIANAINESLENEEEFSMLSSSWIISGHYKPTTPFTGDLTLTTKHGGSYTWPGVPNPVWQAMKAAKGQNGSGAGSVFWALYLRAHKKSFIGSTVATAFKLAGVKAVSPNEYFGKKMSKISKMTKLK